MTKRDNHYEGAFEAFLRERRLPYVAVDETKRSLFGGGSLKSLDFLVSPEGGARWLIDVKGRRFGGGRRSSRWTNWATTDDLESLARWEQIFGDGFRSMLAFAYCIGGQWAPAPAENLFAWRGKLYAFIGVPLEHYIAWSRVRSAKWGTVSMPTARFKELAAPVEKLFHLPAEDQSPGRGASQAG